MTAPLRRIAHCKPLFTSLALTLLAFTVACDKKDDSKLNFSNAIDSYYAAHPACLWSSEIKFPVQADTSDTSKTTGYDALVDQGLLTRTTAEKKVFIVASKQVTNYDLSDKGRSAWTADVQQPGFGNFCYGHRKASSIDSYTPTSHTTGATTQVTYHYSFADAPGWAAAPETQNAFPALHADLAAPQNAQATLSNTSNGWVVSSAPGHSAAPATPADGKIVQ